MGRVLLLLFSRSKEQLEDLAVEQEDRQHHLAVLMVSVEDLVEAEAAVPFRALEELEDLETSEALGDRAAVATAPEAGEEERALAERSSSTQMVLR